MPQLKEKRAGEVCCGDMLWIDGIGLTEVGWSEENPDVAGNLLIHHSEGTYECAASAVLQVRA